MRELKIDQQVIDELVKKIMEVGSKRSSGLILIFDELNLRRVITEVIEANKS